ncbi:MAG: hypothetical protein OWR52_07740 [Acidibacillus sp.]|uniref:Uncharacterized protein n=1 Tax=Sulfoacidibacillus ferrooxidans TaxID=2005001 RepID=A0A9X1V6Z8_9BACL|nr:hypothetical protein [Sulfoacidibacillus ferrooxidans]MCI0181955.1 hypothetical protein [Sulfoacidibacillus ferrooxidans]MCY0893383.1 hypothetical protein [Acidibacillus sp.]
MQLEAQAVQQLLDDLAAEIEQYFGKGQSGSGQHMIVKLEALRKMIETAAPDLIGAYYGYLTIKEEFGQYQVRFAWSAKRFWVFFLWQMGVLIVLLLAGVAFEAQPSILHYVYSINGLSLYLACAWWGALGATLSAIHTLYDSRLNGTLSQNMDAWLAVKPFTGAVLGLVSGFLLQITAYSTTGDYHATGVVPVLFAFFAGFSERKFLTYLQSRLGQLVQTVQKTNAKKSA